MGARHGGDHHHRAAEHKIQGLQQQADGTEEGARHLRWDMEGQGGPGSWLRLRSHHSNRRIQQVEEELDHAQEGLTTALLQLEEAEKALMRARQLWRLLRTQPQR